MAHRARGTTDLECTNIYFTKIRICDDLYLDVSKCSGYWLFLQVWELQAISIHLDVWTCEKILLAFFVDYDHPSCIFLPVASLSLPILLFPL